MNFNPATIEAIIIEPLRYFFFHNGERHGVRWDPDEKKSQIQIQADSQALAIATEFKGRIVVNRGGYMVRRLGLSDSLVDAKTMEETKGLNDQRHMLLYEGSASIIVEARNKGVCELITDMATHVMAWNSPAICDSQGFKSFGLPMQVGPCVEQAMSEDTKKYTVSIQIPYSKEEQWRIRQQGVIMKGINSQMVIPENSGA